MRRVLIAVLGVLAAAVLVLLLLLVLRGRDSGSLQGSEAAPGEPAAAPAAPARPAPVRRDGVALSDAQVATALLAGNVVLVYGAKADEAPLRALQRDVTGPFDPILAQAGQAVVLEHDPGTSGVVARAERRRLQASRPDDPRLRSFAETWVGGAEGE